MEPILEEEPTEGRADSPTGATKRVSKRARGISGLALENSPCEEQLGKLTPPSRFPMDVNPTSVAQTSTATGANPRGPASEEMQLRMNQLETSQAMQEHRQNALGTMVHNRILPLTMTTAIRRLETGQVQRDRRMQTHEQVIELNKRRQTPFDALNKKAHRAQVAGWRRMKSSFGQRTIRRKH